MVHYNDLLDDLDGEMRRVAKFLDIPLMPHLRLTRTDGPRSFFHKGAIGRWRDILTPDDLALYENKIRSKFTPALAAWIEGGRKAAGDPRARPN
jgi:aryl sulfotransferase